jgi:hypothetical protein
MTSRQVVVPAERLTGWFERFVAQHGEATWQASDTAVTVTAKDGTVVECHVPFPPLVGDDSPYGGLAAHALRVRRVGVLLVRKGSYAVGLFDGARRVDSKVGQRHVQGRSAAGGWSQQRFARRREDQAKVAYAAAADVAHRILLPVADTLDALVVGGDDAALKAVLDDQRLARLRAVPQERLGIQDPKREFARGAALFRSLRLVVTDPG